MVDFEKLKQLREKTGISFTLCKKALEEADNDMDKANKVLEKIAGQKIEEKLKKTTKSGGVFSYVHHNGQVASFIELLCETDFVAENNDFKELGHEIALQIASSKPKTIKDLLKQEYVKDSKKKISDLINESVLKFGEKIKISRLAVWNLGE
ncbi:MAG: elongation factor Ts [bacterium]